MVREAAALLVLAACGSHALRAPAPQPALERGSISGRVVSSDGQPIAGASVTVRSATSSRGTETSGDGEFTVTSLAPGTYDVGVALADHAEQRRGIEVTARHTTTLDVSLPVKLLLCRPELPYSDANPCGFDRVPKCDAVRGTGYIGNCFP
jgi:hypothetical protein